MSEVLVYALVFVAVTWGAWVLVPLLAQMGLERSLAKQSINRVAESLDAGQRFISLKNLACACWSGALLGGGGFLALALASGLTHPAVLLSGCLVAGAVLYRLPKGWVARKIKQRQRLFDARLTDLTLGLANGLRAGAALPQSMELVARDIGGPMAEELALVLHEYRLGLELSESLGRMCDRMPSEDLSLLVTAIRLTMKSGGSLAEVLDRITGTIRERVIFRDRLVTMTSQGRFEAIAMASAPVVAFFILFLLDKDLMLPLVQTPTGWCALGAVATLELIGFLIINKIVTIEV